MLKFAQAQDPNALIALGVEGGTYGADPFLLNTDAHVAAFGGYMGFDPDPTTPQLAKWTAEGRLRFVLLPQVFVLLRAAAVTPAGSQTVTSATTQRILSATAQRTQWLVQHCSVVSPERIGSDAADAGTLFDCGL